jgi:hypothetical protein
MGTLNSTRSIPCPYCGGAAGLTPSAHLYNGRCYGPVYDCRTCDAYVGVHKGTVVPLGTPANAELRAARKATHAAFDKTWLGADDRRRQRGVMYRWMQRVMRLSKEDAHIAKFYLSQCAKLQAAVSNALLEDLR